MLKLILLILAAFSFIGFIWLCYLSYQDIRYAIQDPFTLIGLLATFILALIFLIVFLFV